MQCGQRRREVRPTTTCSTGYDSVQFGDPPTRQNNHEQQRGWEWIAVHMVSTRRGLLHHSRPDHHRNPLPPWLPPSLLCKLPPPGNFPLRAGVWIRWTRLGCGRRTTPGDAVYEILNVALQCIQIPSSSASRTLVRFIHERHKFHPTSNPSPRWRSCRHRPSSRQQSPASSPAPMQFSRRVRAVRRAFACSPPADLLLSSCRWGL